MAEVVNLMVPREKHPPGPSPALDFWLKRQAIAIVAQLPEDPEEALRVLSYAAGLVKNFLGGD